MTNTIDLGFTTIDIPQDCPKPWAFEDIVKGLLYAKFPEVKDAAKCKRAWEHTKIIPEPFASNLTAAGHYSSALLALSPYAQAWIAFQEQVNRAFSDQEDDGDRKEPAIPGWTPEGWIKFD